MDTDLMLYRPLPGDRVRLTYGDGSAAEGTWEETPEGVEQLRKDDGTVHSHVSGHVRRSIIKRSDKAPAHPYEGAGWIVERHEWAQEIVGRVVGPLDERGEEGEHWLDRLAQAINDRHAWGEAWDAYRDRNPEPQGDDEAAYDRWDAAGPQATPGARAFGVMSSGEKRLARLIATLSIHKTPWSVEEIGFDQRGARILLDWLAIVRAQLPEFLYDPNYDPDARFREMLERRQSESN